MIDASVPVPVPAVDERSRDVAVALMRMALAVLDRCGDQSFGAARLQHAIDTVGLPGPDRESTAGE